MDDNERNGTSCQFFSFSRTSFLIQCNGQGIDRQWDFASWKTYGRGWMKTTFGIFVACLPPLFTLSGVTTDEASSAVGHWLLPTTGQSVGGGREGGEGGAILWNLCPVSAPADADTLVFYPAVCHNQDQDTIYYKWASVKMTLKFHFLSCGPLYSD